MPRSLFFQHRLDVIMTEQSGGEGDSSCKTLTSNSPSNFNKTIWALSSAAINHDFPWAKQLDTNQLISAFIKVSKIKVFNHETF